MRFFRAAAAALTLGSSIALAQAAPRTIPTFELEHLTFNPAQQSDLLLTGDLTACRWAAAMRTRKTRVSGSRLGSVRVVRSA